MELLNFKLKRKNKHNVEVISLSDKVIKDLDGIEIIGTDVVLDSEVGRPNKISNKWYGKNSYWPFILKFNGISNPHALNEGMKYNVPNLSQFMSKLGYLSTDELLEADVVRTNELELRNFTVDDRKQVFNNRKSTTNKERPSIGTQIKDGVIIFNDNPKTLSSIEESSKLENDLVQLEEICVDCNPNTSDVLIYKILKENKDSKEISKPTLVESKPTTFTSKK